jgi:glycosyltransferase involved in cell wall biosynthesis
MKILLLNYEFPPLGGGASPLSYTLSKQLAKNNELHVVTMHYKNLPRYEFVDGMHIHRVSSLRSKKDICRPYELFSFLFPAYFKAVSLQKKHSFEICHCHFIIPTGIVALLLKKKTNLPYIITSHGSDVLGYNKRFSLLYHLVKPMWKSIVKHASIIGVPSNFLLNKIKDLEPAVKLVNIPNAISPSQFKPKKKKKYFLVVARLLSNKGIQEIILAISLLDMQGYTIKIVGDGPYKNELQELVKKQNLKNIEFLGWIDNNSNQMRKLYGEAFAFISASHFENLSMVLLEAISSGCITIAADVGGNPEILPKKYLFEAKNPQSLSHKINEIISLKLKPIPLEKKFTLEKVAKKYEALLENERIRK